MIHVLVERIGRVGYLTLARAGAMNALDANMIDALAQGLAGHVADGAVEIVAVRSADPRAFCAGGDMKRARELVLAERFDELDRFFADEYALNLAIARCSKPYVALIDGVAMGGGLGISVHGSHRVVTERARLAMPETRIGFFPDVGASHFLPRLAARAGWRLTLSAESVGADEAVAVGLATHRLGTADLATLAGRLERDADASVEEILGERPPVPPEPALAERLERQASWFAAETPERIVAALDEAASRDADAARLRDAVRAVSPYAARMALDLFAGADERDLAAALDRERAAAREAVRHPDFVEGIRAVLIDRGEGRARWA